MTMVDAITADSATPTRIKRVRSSRRVCRVPTMAPPLAHGGRASPSASVAVRCGTPTRVNGLTTSPSAKNGGPGTRCPRPRWCAGKSPGYPRSRWSGDPRRRWKRSSGTRSPRSGPTWRASRGNDFSYFVGRMERNGHGDSTLPPWCVMIPAWTDAPWNGSATTS